MTQETRARTRIWPGPGLTAQQGQAGLEAVAGALQPQLVVHLHVDVLKRWQRRAVRVAVVPAHQGQAPQQQALVDLGQRGSWARGRGSCTLTRTLAEHRSPLAAGARSRDSCVDPSPPQKALSGEPPHLLLHGGRSVRIPQPAATGEGSQHREHCAGAGTRRGH